MTLHNVLSELSPGSLFMYHGKDYLLIDFKPSENFLTYSIPDLFCAVDLTTYQIVCFDGSWEVKLLNDLSIGANKPY